MSRSCHAVGKLMTGKIHRVNDLHAFMSLGKPKWLLAVALF